MRKIGRFFKNIWKVLLVFSFRKIADFSEKFIDETAEITSDVYDDVEEFLGGDASSYCEHFNAQQKSSSETIS